MYDIVYRRHRVHSWTFIYANCDVISNSNPNPSPNPNPNTNPNSNPNPNHWI